MASVIDWYVVELKLLLNEKLPEPRVDEIVKEAEAHLRESVHRKINQGMTDAEATASAVDAYGKPDKVAMGFLKGVKQKLWGLNPVWWAGLGAVVTIYCWNFHWLVLSAPFDNFGETWQNFLAGVIGILGVILLFVAVRAGLRSFRLALTGFTVGAALLSIPVISYWMIPCPNFYGGVSRLHLERDLPMVGQALELMKAYEPYLQRGMHEFASANSVADLSADLRDPSIAAKKFGEVKLYPAVLGVTLDHGGTYVVPRRYGAFFTMGGGSTVLETMADFSDAKKQWAEYGPKDMEDIKKQIGYFGILESNARAAKAGKLFFPDPDIYLETVIATLFLLPFFLVVDWIAALTARPKRRWPRRAIA